ncbi:flippase-like domain-containing protein [Palleronia sediminis]|uniref:Flippase-like domain-containing protein n=1 Tax=Palleronia sediminis TaxID=2547833 RepID=A0A4R6A5B6_9RHOB|nr:lysylphosphatidylglycerol synthase transmembrane domain-containing protein [Palleronia sediminis]TDL76306.1 flippase-like domain-containing protein [Palleronia sediminis]
MKVTTAIPRTTRNRDIALGALFALAIAAGLVMLARGTGWSEVVNQIARLGAVQIAVLLVLSLANYGCRALRWHVCVRRAGLDLPLSSSLRHFLGGFAMSVTPGRVGELVRLRWIGRETGAAMTRIAPLALLDRAADLGAMALILAVSLALAQAGIAGGMLAAGGALALAFIVTRPGLFAAAALGAYRATGRFARPLARLRSAAGLLGRFQAPRVAVPVLALGIVGWAAEGIGLWLLLGWFGAPVGFWAAIAIFTFATLAGGLTGAPGGLGGAEAAMVALLVASDVPLDAAIAATAVIRLTTLWFALAIGLVVFPVAERHATRCERDHALENR